MDWLGMVVRPVVPRPELKGEVLARARAAGRRRRPLAIAAAVALVLAGSGAGVTALMARAALRRADAARQALAQRVAALEDTLSLLRGSGTRVVHVPLRIGGVVTIFTDRATRRWLVACHDMVANAPGQTYQLWFVTAAGRRSAGLMLMEHDRPMMAVLEVPAGAGSVTGVAMTIEPRAGSAVPTGPMVFEVAL